MGHYPTSQDIQSVLTDLLKTDALTAGCVPAFARFARPDPPSGYDLQWIGTREELMADLPDTLCTKDDFFRFVEDGIGRNFVKGNADRMLYAAQGETWTPREWEGPKGRKLRDSGVIGTVLLARGTVNPKVVGEQLGLPGVPVFCTWAVLVGQVVLVYREPIGKFVLNTDGKADSAQASLLLPVDVHAIGEQRPHVLKITAAMKHPDILAYDRLGSPVLLVEVKGKASDDPDRDQRIVQYFLDEWRPAPRPVPFAMLVDPRRIRIFRDRGERPVAELPTEDVLRDYDPEVGSKEIFEFYWISLVEGWLRDLAFHWNSPTPFGSDVLERVGLLPLLEGGNTTAEAAI